MVQRNNKQILNSIIDKVINDPKEVRQKKGQAMPLVFYVGLGKSGSKSIMEGLSVTTAHWHDEFHFESLYGKGFLSTNNILLYDVVCEFGSAFNYRPLIVESYRDPLARSISMLGQHIYSRRLNIKNFEEFKNILTFDFIERMHNPYSRNWKSYFGVNLLKEFDNSLGYLFCPAKNKNVDLLFVRAEDSSRWKNIFHLAGFNYNHRNENSSAQRSYKEIYSQAHSELKFDYEFLTRVYDNDFVKTIYTPSELEGFIAKWLNGSSAESVGSPGCRQVTKPMI